MCEKGPYTKQCEIRINLIRLLTSWLHVQWIRMCTLMLDTTTDEPPCPLEHESERLCGRRLLQLCGILRWCYNETKTLFYWYYPTRNCPGWWGQDHVMPETSAKHGQTSGLEKGSSKLRAQEERSVRELHREIPLSLSRGLSHAFDIAEKDFVFTGSSRISSSQVIWCHTRPYHHMRCSLLQPLRKMGILLSPEHHFFVVRTFIEQYTVFGNVSSRAHESQRRSMSATDSLFTKVGATPHPKVFLPVVSHCWS